MNMIHSKYSNIPQNPTLSGRLFYGPMFLFYPYLSKVNVLPWSSMHSWDPHPRHPGLESLPKHGGRRHPAVPTRPHLAKNVGSDSSILQTNSLVGLRCSLLNSFHSEKQYHQMISKWYYIYILMSYDITENKQQLPLCEKTIPLFNKEPQELLNSHLIPPQTKAASPARPWIKAHASSSPTLPREGWHWSQSLLTEAIHGCSWSTFVPLDIKKPSTLSLFSAMISRSFLFILYLEGFVGRPTKGSVAWNKSKFSVKRRNSLAFFRELSSKRSHRYPATSGSFMVRGKTLWHSFLKLLLLVF